METHPIKQPIQGITVWNGNSNLVEVGAYEPEAYRIGFDGVTRIEACEKPGEYCMLPYVRVWTGDLCLAEFAQHKLVGVYFEPELIPEPQSEPPATGFPPDHTGNANCLCDVCIPF